MEVTYEAQRAALNLAEELAGDLSALPLQADSRPPSSAPVVKVPRWLVRFIAFITRSERARLARDWGGVAIMALVIEPPKGGDA